MARMDANIGLYVIVIIQVYTNLSRTKILQVVQQHVIRLTRGSDRKQRGEGGLVGLNLL